MYAVRQQDQSGKWETLWHHANYGCLQPGTITGVVDPAFSPGCVPPGTVVTFNGCDSHVFQWESRNNPKPRGKFEALLDEFENLLTRF